MKEFCLIPRITAEKMNEGSASKVAGTSLKVEKKEMVGRGTGTEDLLRSINELIRTIKGEKKSHRVKKTQKCPFKRKRKVFTPTLDPLPLPKKSLIPLNEEEENYGVHKMPVFTKNYEKPNLEALINLSISPASREAAKALLTFFDKKEHIRWDSKGQLISPIDNYNVIDIIKTLLQSKANIKKSDIPFYRLILNEAGIVPELIKNMKLRQQLFAKHSAWEAY